MRADAGLRFRQTHRASPLRLQSFDGCLGYSPNNSLAVSTKSGTRRCVRDELWFAPSKAHAAESNVLRGGFVHWPPAIALEPPSVCPASTLTSRPPSPGFGCESQDRASSGSLAAVKAWRMARTRSSEASGRGAPRSKSVKVRPGIAAHSRAARTQPAVPPPMIM